MVYHRIVLVPLSPLALDATSKRNRLGRYVATSSQVQTSEKVRCPRIITARTVGRDRARCQIVSQLARWV